MTRRKVNFRFIFERGAIFIGILALFMGIFLFVLVKLYPSFFPPYMNLINTFLLTSGAIISILGSVFSDILGFHLSDLFKPKIKGTNTSNPNAIHFPFEIMTDQWRVLPALLPGPGIIPEYKLPYHRRNIDENTTETLRSLLFRYRKILVSGISGIGKTREVGKLVTELIDEGYTLLRAENSTQLDSSIVFPDTLRHRIILLFDDMHQRCADPITQFSQELTAKDFLDNTKSFIERTEKRFGPTDVLTIFIARSDVQAWDFLQYPNHALWEGVFNYKLPYPDIECQKEFLLHVTHELSIPINSEAALELAKANDFTFRNLIQNIYRAKLSNVPLTPNNFIPKQGQTWSDRYQILCEIFPREIPAVFHTLFLLRRMKVVLRPILVTEVATISILGANIYSAFPLARFFTRRRIYWILSYLQKNGDLILDSANNEFAIHETMLAAHQSDNEKESANRIITLISKVVAMDLKGEIEVWMAIANFLIFNIGNLKLGLQILTRIIRINPYVAQARYIRAQALLFAGFIDEALNDINFAYKLEPENLEILVFRGIIFGTINNFEEAENNFNKVLDLSKDNVYAYINRANIYFLKDKFRKAIGDLSKAIKLQPNDVRIYILRARAYWGNGEKQAAYNDLTTALNLQPRLTIVHTQRAEFYLNEGLLDIALEEINKAIEITPNASEFYFIKSLIFKNKKELKEAFSSINQAIYLYPYSSKYYRTRADIFFDQGKKIDGLTDINKALALSPHDSNTLLKRAIYLRHFGAANLAYKDLLHILVHNPNLPDAYLQLCQLHSQWGQLNQALEYANKCLQLSPNWSEAYHARAHIYDKQHKTQLALDDFDKAIDLEPNNGVHYFCRGEFKRFHRQRDSIRDHAIARELSPGKIAYQFAYIAAHKDFNRTRRAKQIYERLLLNNPEDIKALVACAYISFLEGNISAAESYLKKALASQVSDPVTEYHLLWVAIMCKKVGITLKAIIRSTNSNDPEFILEYFEHFFRYIPKKKWAYNMGLWFIKTQLGISRQGTLHSRLVMIFSKFRNQKNIITKNDITV